MAPKNVERWLVSVASFLWSWWAVIILVGGFVVAGFWHFFKGTPLPGKIVLCVALILAVSLIFRDRGRIKARFMDWLNDRRAGPLDLLNATSLRQTASLVEKSIRALESCNYGSDGAEREFKSHFRPLGGLLDGWLDIRAEELISRKEARQWAQERVTGEFPEPEYWLSSVALNLQELCSQVFSKNASPTMPPTVLLALDNVENKSMVWFYPDGKFNGAFPVNPGDPESTKRKEEHTQAFVQRWINSAEFQRAVRARDARLPVQAQMLHFLKMVQEHTDIHGHCESCFQTHRSSLYRVSN